MAVKLKKPIVFERGDKLFLVGPLAPMDPSVEQIEEYAFADAVKRARETAPNPMLKWFGGHYVEADQANGNGAMWTADEIAIKSLTPMFMPVTVMHDPSTAVGLIADTNLKTPDEDGVPRSKIETALALWSHRFPEAAEEAQFNYEAGTLMQSMECFAPDYSCSACGMTYHKLQNGAEQDQWCEHLQAANPSGGYFAGGSKKKSGGEVPTAVRILRNVCFTGTGLIYGSRGARGADPQAHLEGFQEEVAEYHDRTHRSSRPKRNRRRTTSSMDPIEISKQEYNELLAAKQKVESAERARDEAVEQVESKDQEIATLKKDAETLEAEKKTAEEKAEAAETKVKDAEEAVRAETLKTERLEALGKDFKEKLGDTTRKNLEADAAKLSDDDWKARLDEVAELVDVKPDAGGTGEAAGKEKADETVFDREEVASTQAGNAGGAGSQAERGSVVGGLFTQATGSKK